ncbi:MAG: hypothetical protein WAX69_18425 [Victivallales bacterium]
MKAYLFSARSIVALLITLVFIVALTFTIKVIAEDWNGKIGDTKTINLDPSECTGTGPAGPCYKILTCSPDASKCECTEEGDWH